MIKRKIKNETRKRPELTNGLVHITLKGVNCYLIRNNDNFLLIDTSFSVKHSAFSYIRCRNK